MGKVKQIKAKRPGKRGAVEAVAKGRNKANRPGKRGGVEAVANRRNKANRPGKRSGVTARANGPDRVAPVPKQRPVRVKELMPQAVCGPRTRVQQVFRVEERLNGSSQTHLVFNDRHGWYCEHGADCPAVDEVRKAR